MQAVVDDASTRADGPAPLSLGELLRAHLEGRRGPLPPPCGDGRWEVRAVLGQGGFGVVCRAFDLVLGRQVALKLLPDAAIDDAHSRYVAREAQALAQLEHPNVVAVYSTGRLALAVGGQVVHCLYIEMALVVGLTLGEWLVRGPTQAEIFAVLRQAGEGLAAAHEAGLIHRDFKPDNLMVDERGRVRVVDFGLAKRPGLDHHAPVVAEGETARVQYHALEQPLTQRGIIAGTPDYMAPEAWTGAPTAASDQYAFALVAWEALTGRRLRASRHDALVHGRPHRLTHGRKIPRRLRRALRRALAVDPARRYPSMRALLDDPAWVLDGRPRLRRWVIVGGLGLAAAGAAGWLAYRDGHLDPWLAGWAGQPAPESDQPPNEPAEPSPRRDPSADELRAARAAALARQAERCGWAVVPPLAAELTAVFRWAERPGHRGSKHYYELELGPAAGCRLEVKAAKVGDSSEPRYEQARSVTRTLAVSPRAGWLELAPLELGQISGGSGRVASLQLTLEPGRAVGWLTIVDGRGERILDGPVFPGFSPPMEQMPDYDTLPCALQCRARCAGEAARARCLEATCAEPRRRVERCGPPGADWSPPAVLREAIASWQAEGVLPGAFDQKPTIYRGLAKKYLAGRWAIELARADGSVAQAELQLTVEGDALSGTLSAPELGVASATVRGRVLPTGPWLVEAVSASGEAEPTIRWALSGWDPAFGASWSGERIAAYRR